MTLNIWLISFVLFWFESLLSRMELDHLFYDLTSYDGSLSPFIPVLLSAQHLISRLYLLLLFFFTALSRGLTLTPLVRLRTWWLLNGSRTSWACCTRSVLHTCGGLFVASYFFLKNIWSTGLFVLAKCFPCVMIHPRYLWTQRIEPPSQLTQGFLFSQ